MFTDTPDADDRRRAEVAQDRVELRARHRTEAVVAGQDAGRGGRRRSRRAPAPPRSPGDSRTGDFFTPANRRGVVVAAPTVVARLRGAVQHGDADRPGRPREPRAVADQVDGRGRVRERGQRRRRSRRHRSAPPAARARCARARRVRARSSAIAYSSTKPVSAPASRSTSFRILPGRVARQRPLAHLPVLGHLVVRELPPRTTRAPTRRRSCGRGRAHDHRLHPLPELGVVDADDRALLDVGMVLDELFDLDRVDVLAAAEDQVALARREVEAAAFHAARCRRCATNGRA